LFFAKATLLFKTKTTFHFMKPSRRDFLKTSLAGVSIAQLEPKIDLKLPDNPLPTKQLYNNQTLSLSPAQWIWLPSQRTLANSIIQFRLDFELPASVKSGEGYILADSRYKLFINGQRQQFGPAPADPRLPEADPLPIGNLKAGKNSLAVEVLYYGHGDGTWAIGKPGLIFKWDLLCENGSKVQVVSNLDVKCRVARTWKPGQFKRWYLRSFQEEFDARLYDFDWQTKALDASWLKPMLLPGSQSDKPAVSSYIRDYLYDAQGKLGDSAIRQRNIAMMSEEIKLVSKLSDQAILEWKVLPETYFEFQTPENESFTSQRINFAKQVSAQNYAFTAQKNKAYALAFEFSEQMVGFPIFEIEANEGTVVELMVHEGHNPKDPKHILLNTHYFGWTRLICKAGLNRFETFDFESARWLQLHVRNAEGEVKIQNVGMRERNYPIKNTKIKVSDPAFQKLIEAGIRTYKNSAQETVVDGMGRERQQYSGDLGHMVHAISRMGGVDIQNARFLNTWSQGITQEGFFLDTWPAYDRLVRLMERQMGLTEWGPILDHGIGFMLDCWSYYMYTGDKDSLNEIFPRLKKFFTYLQSIKTSEGLLPVENIGVPNVWIDHEAYKQQKHKQCAFNLYAVASLRNGFAKICTLFEDRKLAQKALAEADNILAKTRKKYWSETDKVFVNNLPWHIAEGEKRMCDRSLATAIIHDLVSKNDQTNFVNILVEVKPNLGISYPANAIWRYWALAKGGRIETILQDFRTKWMAMNSVKENNTLGEAWQQEHNTWAQWSHAPLSPIFIVYDGVAGIKPTAPNYATFEIQPQMADLTFLEIENQTQHGAIYLRQEKVGEKWKVKITFPAILKGNYRFKGKNVVLSGGMEEFEV
jgi:alpha-L-rhamnosidase